MQQEADPVIQDASASAPAPPNARARASDRAGGWGITTRKHGRHHAKSCVPAHTSLQSSFMFHLVGHPRGHMRTRVLKRGACGGVHRRARGGLPSAAALRRRTL
eukprot:386751-Prymnesium_polylepis.1